MHGFFKDGFPCVEVIVAGNADIARKVQAIIDTGFNGHLALSYSDAFPLGLTLDNIDYSRVADGNFTPHLRCTGTVMLGSSRIQVQIEVQENSRCLLGTALVKDLGGRLTIDPAGETVELVARR